MACRYRFLDHPGPIAFAHRGGSAESPENTWAAFSHAVSLGYDYMETDVHATADGVVVAIHDSCLDRLSDRTGNVAELDWKQVGAARLAGGEVVPRLDELLAAWPSLRWNVDAKHDSVVRPLVEVVKRARAVERVCVTSFSGRRTAQVRAALGPLLCTGAGPREIGVLRLASAGGDLWRRAAGGGGGEPAGGGARGLAPRLPVRLLGDAGAAQVPLRYKFASVVDTSFVRFAHSVGMAVHVWTIDDAATMEHLLDVGVDGIMTDRPSLLRDVLVARAQWQ